MDIDTWMLNGMHISVPWKFVSVVFMCMNANIYIYSAYTCMYVCMYACMYVMYVCNGMYVMYVCNVCNVCM